MAWSGWWVCWHFTWPSLSLLCSWRPWHFPLPWGILIAIYAEMSGVIFQLFLAFLSGSCSKRDSILRISLRFSSMPPSIIFPFIPVSNAICGIWVSSTVRGDWSIPMPNDKWWHGMACSGDTAKIATSTIHDTVWLLNPVTDDWTYVNFDILPNTKIATWGNIKCNQGNTSWIVTRVRVSARANPTYYTACATNGKFSRDAML